MSSREAPEPKRPTQRVHTHDILIVAAAGQASDHAHQLLAALKRDGIRVRLAVVSSPSVLAIETEVRDAAFCLAMAVRDGSTGYALIPAPRVEGQVARFANPAAKGFGDEI